MADAITNSQDVIDVRDVIARFEELDAILVGDRSEDEREEFASLQSLLEDLEGCGGDEEWRGAWYPLILVRDSYFVQHAEDEAEGLGLIDRNAAWPRNHINWEAAAAQLQNDYVSVDFDGETYWYR